MNNQNSYYLYQQYEKRGSQDWLPCYPNIYSVDGDGTMPLVLRKENDPQCGYVPPVEPIYRWYNLPIETDYICDECPPVHDYRWVNMPITTDWECVGTDQYYKQKKQYTLNGTDWYDVEPLQTQRGSLYQSQSVTCGYVPPVEPQYRTISGTPYCQSVDKYVDVYSQVSYDGGSTWTTTATTPTLVERNSQECGYVPPAPTPTAYTEEYLTFVTRESGTFKFSAYTSSNKLSYSLDNGSTWTNLGYNATSPVIDGGRRVMWKGTCRSSVGNGIGTFISSGNFDVEGNPMSLLYGDNFIGKTSLAGKDSAMLGLFSGNTNVISAKYLTLPATTLEKRCYYLMFYKCTNLTTAPIDLLPATALTQSCYDAMFSGCTSLTIVPELPATTLADQCYCGMFSHCASLATAPALPATTLDTYCYDMMFQSCTSLATAPLLPATTLESGCYRYMFQGCTSLTTAPELPATTLVSNCYRYMFRYCSNLNYIKCLATGISAENCTNYWVSGVSSSGTFVKNSSMSSWTTGINGIPTNWTVTNA